MLQRSERNIFCCRRISNESDGSYFGTDLLDVERKQVGDGKSFLIVLIYRTSGISRISWISWISRISRDECLLKSG